MNKKIMLVVMIVIVLVVLGLVARNFMTDTNSISTNSQPTATISSVSPTVTAVSAVKELTVTGSNYKFDPNEINVKQGDTVKIIFKNNGGFHNFILNEFNVKTKTIGSDEQDTIQFTADKRGTFEYYCSVGNHRQMGMVGKLNVL